jgi:hypothetical protein
VESVEIVNSSGRGAASAGEYLLGKGERGVLQQLQAGGTSQVTSQALELQTTSIQCSSAREHLLRITAWSNQSAQVQLRRCIKLAVIRVQGMYIPHSRIQQQQPAP